MRFHSLLSALLSAFLVVGLVGCAGGNEITHSGPEEAYEKGMDEYEEEDYEDAIRYFRAVFDYGRGNEWAPDAQFQLAMAQRKQGKYLVAANEFERFQQLYQNDDRVPRAQYERARAYYSQSPAHNLDQTHTRQAISLFQLFIDRHSDHELVSDAEEKIAELREKLAHKKYDAGTMYEQRRMWRAATETHERVFDQYPDTEWADDALLGAIRSYVRYADRSIQRRQGERYQQAIDYYSRLEQLFPDSPLLDEAKPLRDEAQRKLEDVREREESQSIAQEDTSGDAR
ncbi:MAG: outer membrane protein assembly factor BamD [Salinivenus sp.]